jgi:hypothetical protein
MRPCALMKQMLKKELIGKLKWPGTPRGAMSGSQQRPNAAALIAVALGAFAIGAIAVGYLAIGRLDVQRARIRELEIDELTVRRLKRARPVKP